MLRSAIAPLLLVSLGLAGCGLFGDKKQPLPGERISVLSLDRQLEPDPDVTKIPITLPPPVVNAEWPEPGGYPNHAMQHLASPARCAAGRQSRTDGSLWLPSRTSWSCLPPMTGGAYGTTMPFRKRRASLEALAPPSKARSSSRPILRVRFTRSPWRPAGRCGR